SDDKCPSLMNSSAGDQSTTKRWPIPTVAYPHSRAGGSGVVWATHANPSISTTSRHKRNKMVAATRELPASGYALEVDGRLKAEFATKDGAKGRWRRTKETFSHASDQD